MSTVDGRSAEKRHMKDEAENDIPKKESKLENGVPTASGDKILKKDKAEKKPRNYEEECEDAEGDEVNDEESSEEEEDDVVSDDEEGSVGSDEIEESDGGEDGEEGDGDGDDVEEGDDVEGDEGESED